MTIPAPILFPTRTTMRSLAPRPAPTARSPQAETESSLAIQSGVRGVRACSSLMKGTSRQPRVGALRTRPCSRSMNPATPRPIAFISENGIPAAPHAVFAARSTASATCGGSLESKLCFSCPSTPPVASTPATVDDEADAVDFDGLAVLAQPLFGELDGAELLLLGEVEADLGRRVRSRDAVEHPAQRPAIARDEFQEPRGGIDAVVESEVAVAEEDVAAHLAGEERVLFFHLRLDQRMARLPHDGPSAVLLDVVVERLRALHLTDDGGAGALGEHVAREEDHQLIAPEDAAVVVDGAEAVRVAIPGDTQVGVAVGDLLLQVAQVRLDRPLG